MSKSANIIFIDGQIIGMAMAVFQSDVYGLAVNARSLVKALEGAARALEG